MPEGARDTTAVQREVSGPPILVFDSGLGGLSVLACIRESLPDAPIVYAMDEAGYPYGSRTDTDISRRLPRILARLAARYRPALAVIACNTASTIALAAARAALDIPVIGTVPAVRTAAERSRTRVIGILGTAATVRQAYVDRLVADFAADCVVLRHGAPDLVDYVEAHLRDRQPLCPNAPISAIQSLLDQPEGASLDTVVLACTHFPLVADKLATAAPRVLTLIDSGEGIARRVASLYQSTPQNGPATGIAVSTLVSSQPQQSLRGLFARYGLNRFETCA